MMSISVFVQLSISFRWLHAFSACASIRYQFPNISDAIWTLSLRRSLEKLEDFVVAHFSDQLLRFLTESGQSPQISCSPSATYSCLDDLRIALLIVELLLFSIGLNLFNSGMWNARDSNVNTIFIATSLPCADELHSHGHRIFSILTQVHPSERVASSAQVLLVDNLGDLCVFCCKVLPLFSCKPLLSIQIARSVSERVFARDRV